MSERRTQVGFGAVEGETPSSTPSAPAEPPPPEPAPQQLPHAAVVSGGVPTSAPPDTSEKIETLSRSFIGISLKRAFRLQIKNEEVIPSERETLVASAAHVTDPPHQAFLAWRRSVLLLVALMFVPLTVFRFLEAFDGPKIPMSGRIFMMFPAFAEMLFCLVMFAQLNKWAQWKRQRRILFVAWALYFLAPFLVYVYPFRDAFDSTGMMRQASQIGGVALGAATRAKLHMVVGLAFGVQALLALGPKVISLMPGLIRASVVTKLLFPGTTAPGWLMMLAAPFYALFAYIIVLLPYQITGSWQFVLGNLGIIVAQIFIGISGRRLTVPLTEDDSKTRIGKTWMAYILIMVLGAGFMVYGLYDFITELDLGLVRVVTGVLAFVSNVLLDTLIGTDAIIAAMAHFRQKAAPDPRHEILKRDSEAKLDTFTA